MRSRAKDAESTKFDVFRPTRRVYVKGMLLTCEYVCAYIDTCADARKQELSASNMWRVADQRREVMVKRKIAYAT